MILRFLEFKEEQIVVDCYNCESLVSSDESLSDWYKLGLEKIEEFIKSKENKLMMKDIDRIGQKANQNKFNG